MNLGLVRGLGTVVYTNYLISQRLSALMRLPPLLHPVYAMFAYPLRLCEVGRV